MFRWLMDGVRGLRIAADFKKYEARARAARTIEADDRFSTRTLEETISERMAGPKREADAIFGPAMEQLRKAIAHQTSTQSRLRSQLVVLRRDYKGELSPLYGELNGLVAESRFSSAHAEHNTDRNLANRVSVIRSA